ncbi:hypothetical protein ACR9GP_22705 [Enterobacter ludwigii]
MSETAKLFPVVRDEIEFETLLTQAMQALNTYSGQYWTDMAEHDPGITLLEAQGFNVADLAYRQTRPLTDLLTPSPNKQTEEGLFPAEFGPHQALTCGPISEEDYRRALLDLHSTGNDGGHFFFRNVQLIREPEAERYTYWYNIDLREYSFYEPSAESVSQRFTLQGNYHLFLLPSRETQQNPEAAKHAVDIFLRDNRNLCEAVSRIIWLKPIDFHPKMVIELNDDVGSGSNIAAILADIYQVTEEFISPAAQHYSTEQLQAEGLRSEDIHHGPWLQHGWIPELPPQIDGTSVATVNLSGLVGRLLAVEGVKRIRNLDATPDDAGMGRWQWKSSVPGAYPLLWGSDPLTILAAGETVQLLASGDVRLTATKEAIESEIIRPDLIKIMPQVIPYGRFRDPARYYPATDTVPPCYDLRIPASTHQQMQLHQFLLAFEQLLANSFQQLAKLPELLAFQRSGDAVWGQQWPFAADSVSDNVHHTYRSALQKYMIHHAHDRDQELAITGFLLGYFNSRLAPNIFTQTAHRYLESQHGFLSRHTELTYHRANVRVDRVSALQRRIAARLGLGGAETFKDDIPLNKLPFYLIEHRALMPSPPSEQYIGVQRTVNVSLENVNKRIYLVLTGTNWDVSALKVWQLIDFMLYDDESSPQVIRGQMVQYVNVETNSFWLDVGASVQLELHLKTILSASPDSLGWRNCEVWLQDMDYALIYAENQGGLEPNQKRLSCSPFPVMVKEKDKLILEYLVTPGGPSGEGLEFIQTLTVKAVDRIANMIVVEGERDFPPEGSTKRYWWHFSSEVATKDRFTFMLSAVFNQDLLLNLTSDPYATERWVKEVILDEIPSHTGVLLHWKPWWEFEKVANTYKHWQNGGATLGDRSYDLLHSLALGHLPDGVLGIGSMYIATPEQKEEVIGAEGGEWHSEVIFREDLFYVPDISLIPGEGINDPDNG